MEVMLLHKNNTTAVVFKIWAAFLCSMSIWKAKDVMCFVLFCFVFICFFVCLNVGGVVAREESMTDCHQCQSDTLDATPAARMSGEVNLSLCNKGQIPHSTNKEKEGSAEARSLQHIISNKFFRKIFTHHRRKNCSPADCSSPITALTKLLQPLLVGRTDKSSNNGAKTSTLAEQNSLKLHLPSRRYNTNTVRFHNTMQKLSRDTHRNRSSCQTTGFYPGDVRSGNLSNTLPCRPKLILN